MSATTTVTIAQALASNASNLHVVDTAADIAAALPNAALVARVHLFTLNANATITAATAEKLAGLGGKFQLGGEQLVVRDTLAAIGSAANAAGVALATVRQVADAAFNLLNAPGGSFAHVNSVVLLGSPTLNVAQYGRLQALPGFSVNPSTHVTLADSLSAIAGLVATHPAWLLPVTSVAIRLDGSSIGAFGATQIATLEGHGTSVSFISSGQNTTLPVSATAQDLAANAVALNHLAGQVALSFAVTDQGTTLTASQATILSGLSGFNPATNSLSVSDTGVAISTNAAALFGHGFTTISVTSGTLAGTAAQLLDGTLHLGNGAGALLVASVVLNAAQAASLLALPNFSRAHGATVAVADTTTNLLTEAGALTGANSVTVTDSETLSGAQAVQLATVAQEFGGGFSLGGHAVTVQDSAANLLALPQAVLAIITGSVLSADATVTAGQFVTLRDTLHVSLGGHGLTVQDSATNLLSLSGSLTLAHACVLSADATISGAQATTLAAEPGFSAGGHLLTISDTAANLLALPAPVLTSATAEQISQSAVVSASTLAALAAVPNISLGLGVVLSVSDTAANLLALPAGANALAGGFQLATSATVTAPQFVMLRDNLHVALHGAALTVSDNAANLLGLAGENLSLATSCVLSGNATVSAAQAALLASEPDFSTGGHALTISDSAVNLLALPQPVQLQASMLLLNAAQTVNAAQLAGLVSLGITFSAAGHAVTVADNVTALATLSAPELALAGAEQLNTSATVSAATAASLAALPAFSVAGTATLTVMDSATNLLALPASALAIAGSERLTPGAVTLTAAQAAGLAGLPHFSAAGATISVADTIADLNAAANAAWPNVATTLNVVDSAANLAASAGSGLVQGAASVTLNGNAQIGVTQAVALAGIPHFSLGTAQLIVQGTAAAVAAQATAIADVASLVEVTGSGTVTALQADALAALANSDTLVFQGGNQLQVADTYAALTAASNAAGAALAARLSVVDTGANLAAAAAHNWGAVNPNYVLSANSIVSAAQAAELAGLGSFYSAGGHLLAAADTATNLLGLSPASQALLSSELVSQSTAVNAATLVTLMQRPGFGLTGDVVLTVNDSATALLALPPAAGSFASIFQLSGNTAVSAAQAQVLAAEPGFSTGGHIFTITGNAAALLSLPPSVASLATNLALAASETVTAPQLTALAALGSIFSTAGHGLIVADAAAGLAALAPGAVALASGEILTQSAVVNAATDAILAALPALVFANGVSLSVQDTASALLGLSPSALAIASSVALSANATVSAAQLLLLRDSVGVALNGHTLVVADSAADLLALSGNLGLASACVLNANATVTAAQAVALSAEPGFSAGGFALTVTGSAAQLLALAAPIQAMAASLVLNAPQTVTSAQLNGLAALGTALNAGGHAITVADSAAALAGLTAPSLALASAEVVNASATITAATADAVAALAHVSLGNGVALAVQDSAAALLGVTPAAAALISSLALTANATVDAVDFVTLRSLGVSLAGHVLTVSDNASSLLALAGGSLVLAGACILSGPATVTTSQAVALAGEPGFSTGGHPLAITGTATSLLALSPPMLALASGLQVTSSQTLVAADAATLAALPNVSFADGAVITVQDSAAALLGLSAAARIQDGAYVLSASATVNASQFAMLRDTLHVALGGHALTIQDSAGALIALAGSNLALAGACVLSANATVNASQALTLAGEPGFSVGAATLTIQDNVADLLALPAPIQALATSLVLSASQDVSAAQATTLAGISAFSLGGNHLMIHDTAAALTGLGAPALALASAEILSQNAAVSAITAASLASLGNFSVGEGVSLIIDDTASTLLTLAPSVTAIATGYELSANAVVDAADFTTLRGLDTALGGHTLTINDSASNLLALSGSNLSLATACTLNGNATVGYWQAEDLAAEPGFSNGGHILTVADSANNLLSLPQNVLAVTSLLELNGNQWVGTDELPGLAALGTQFSANGYSIAVLGDVPGLLALSASALALATSEVLTQSAVVTAEAAGALVALGNFSLGNGATLTVDDTAATLLALPASVHAVATGYELSADGTVSASGFTTLRDTLAVAANGHSLTIADSGANLLSLAGSNLSLASACVLNANASVTVAQALSLATEPNFSAGGHVLTISGSASAISQNLSSLEADFGGYGSHFAITLTDQSPSIQVNAATYAADRAVLDAITNAASVTVNDGAAAIASLAATLAADAQVVQVNVSDSAVGVVENLAGLLALGSKLDVTLTDQTPLAASLVPFLVQLSNVTTTVGVSDTAAQIAAVVEQAESAGTTAAITFLETNGVTLSADGAVSIGDWSALWQLGNALNRNGHAVYIYDAVSHLTAAGYASALAGAQNAGLINGVYIKAPGGTVSVSAPQALLLFDTAGASNGYPPPQTGHVTVTVADTAANIEASFASLVALRSNTDIASFVVTSSATITDAVLGDLQTLHAVASNGVSLTVRDTAAAIAAHAVVQSTGQTIAPGTWLLNGNATVSEAQAAVLGGLAHFSAGGYTLTLNLNANTSISVADANALANIAGALNLNGHLLEVAGTVAQLSAVSATAWAVITPELTDTLANISTLSASSPLLAGSVAISDAESLTTAQASAFLGLVASGGGSGIHIGSLDFAGHSETVTGSIAQLQALTASTAWTNTTSLHGAFSLVASDSVTNLTNTATTTFLAGLAGTTLSADATITAASAESLAGLAAQINFSQGGHTIIVQDNAANLVALQNSAGVALANTIELSAPASVNAADAETLLSNSHLVLNTQLTIADSSTNLLDSTLISDIVNSGYSAYIHVQLIAPETLDAITSENLVALPGFDDTHNLTIADSSAYLLASPILSAEQQAIAVTLAGDETVSANTVLRLSELPHFTVGDNLLTLAGNDFADAATLKAIADLGSNFTTGGHTITATADVLDLTPTEYAHLQNDNVFANGHAISAMLVNDSVTHFNNMMSVSATGVAGATVNIYDSTGTLLSTTLESQAGFTVTAPDTGTGHAFAITETVSGVESAPMVVLEANLLETAVAAAGAQFGSSGAIEVDSGKYLNLYLSTAVPQNLQAPALVYNATAHTVSLDIPGASAITLITLGSSTHPASLDLSEILIKHHG